MRDFMHPDRDRRRRVRARGRRRGRRAVRLARRADRALRRQLGRDDQARRERVPDDADLVHQRDRERLRGDRRRRRRGRRRASASTTASARTSCAPASATAARACAARRPSASARATTCARRRSRASSTTLADGDAEREVVQPTDLEVFAWDPETCDPGFFPVAAITRRWFEGELLGVKHGLYRGVRATPDHPSSSLRRRAGRRRSSSRGAHEGRLAAVRPDVAQQARAVPETGSGARVGWIGLDPRAGSRSRRRT